jgi:hypothetical protein
MGFVYAAVAKDDDVVTFVISCIDLCKKVVERGFKRSANRGCYGGGTTVSGGSGNRRISGGCSEGETSPSFFLCPFS